jgi:Alpha galactosidase C-terminal beta sandwich domain
MSLWALGASTWILGTDLTNLDPTDLSYLKNPAVISVDEDGIDARRIVETNTEQVFAKIETDGDAVVGLFNTSSEPEVISTTAAMLGLPERPHYRIRDLWTHELTTSDGTISADVPTHGVALFRVSPAHRWW